VARSLMPDLAGLYHLNSSNTRAKAGDYTVDDDAWPRRYRVYSDARRIALPGRDHHLGEAPLGEVLGARRSIRNFESTPVDLASMGRLLFAGYGVGGVRQVEENWTHERPVPSAGGLYPLELHVATRAINGLADALYHYSARSHELELRREGNLLPQLVEMTIDQPMICTANAVVLVAAVTDRTMWKYGQRGYRYVWLEAGHVGQNLYLAATALGLGAVAIGGFFDQEVARLFRLPSDEHALYLVVIGVPATLANAAGSRSTLTR
jgi:SagB-type dehydrogenase family enzyme